MSRAIESHEHEPVTSAESGADDALTRQHREARLGRRLRAARKARRLSLRELAGRLDVSASFISQMENGKARPSVATLYTMSSALGVSMDELFREEETDSSIDDVTQLPEREGPASRVSSGGAEGSSVPPSPGNVVRSRGRRRLELDSGVVWEQLASLPGSEIDFMLVTYAVGGSSTPDDRLLRHTGVEYGYVHSGRLEVTLGFETLILEEGDSVAFDSTNPHRLTNAGDAPAEVIWFVRGRGDGTPPQL